MAANEDKTNLPHIMDYRIPLVTNFVPVVQADSTTPHSVYSDGATIVGSPDGIDKLESPDPKSVTTHIVDYKGTTAAGSVHPTSWKPMLFRAGPLSGLLALGFVVLQVLVSYVILAASDGRPTRSWKYQPSVYLAILTAISNKALAFAAVQGTVITWWLHSVQGTTLGQLHRDWAYGLYTYKALFSGRHFNLLALACVVATLVGPSPARPTVSAIDGPLLQRSTTVTSKVTPSTLSLAVAITPKLPAYLSGIINPQLLGWQAFSPTFVRVAKDYGTNVPISMPNTGCIGVCRTTALAPALAVRSCTSELKFFNFSTPLSPKFQEGWNSTAGGLPPLPPMDRLILEVGTGIVLGTPEMIELRTRVVQQPEDGSCAAYVNTTSCLLISAVANYSIEIKDDSLSLVDLQPHIVAEANNTAVTNSTVEQYHLHKGAPKGYVWTTLTGLVHLATMQFQSATYFVQWPGAAAPSTIFYQNGWFSFLQGMSDQDDRRCINAITDPRDYIMGQLNLVMFRLGAHYGKHRNTETESPMDAGIRINQTVNGTTTEAVEIFQVDFDYFVAAAAVELFSSLVVLCTFWGYWRLGRSTSLSPLEIAKAFDIVALRDVGSNYSAREIVELTGDQHIQYGVLNDEIEHSAAPHDLPTEKLGFATGAMIHEPMTRHPGWSGCVSLVRTAFRNQKRRQAPGHGLVIDSRGAG